MTGRAYRCGVCGQRLDRAVTTAVHPECDEPAVADAGQVRAALGLLAEHLGATPLDGDNE